MDLVDFLHENKASILKKWLKEISEGYPTETCKFLQLQKDQFANPVGHTFRTETEHIFDELLKEKCSDEIVKYVDGIMRMMAVQEFTPSGAASFMFRLKSVIRGVLAKKKRQDLYEGLLEMESRIDQVALLSFDIYVKCREQIWQFKANAIRDRTHNLLEKAKLWRSPSDDEEGSDEDI